jgi:transcription antitermination factor NusG
MVAEAEKKWYVVYTKPRWEKKVNRVLGEKGFETYCPLNKVQKKWSDRMKIVEEPLFKSYVFVKVTEGEQPEVRMTNGVLNFIYWLGKPAIVQEKEINLIKKFLNEYQHVQVEALPEIEKNMKVTVKQGAFTDQKARVVKVINKNKVQLIIENIGYSLVAIVDKTNISIAGIN